MSSKKLKWKQESKKEKNKRPKIWKEAVWKITWRSNQELWIVKSLSRVQLFGTPWTVAYQAPQSMEFSRQEYWSGLPFPSPGDLPKPGIKPGSPALQADGLTSEPPGKPTFLLILIQCSVRHILHTYWLLFFFVLNNHSWSLNVHE